MGRKKKPDPAKAELNVGDVYEPFIGVDLASGPDATGVFRVQWGSDGTEDKLEPPNLLRNELLDVPMKEGKADLRESLRRSPMPQSKWRSMSAAYTKPRKGDKP